MYVRQLLRRGGFGKLQRYCKVELSSWVSGRLTAGAVAQARRPSKDGGYRAIISQGNLLPGEVSRLGVV